MIIKEFFFLGLIGIWVGVSGKGIEELLCSGDTSPKKLPELKRGSKLGDEVCQKFRVHIKDSKDATLKISFSGYDLISGKDDSDEILFKEAVRSDDEMIDISDVKVPDNAPSGTSVFLLKLTKRDGEFVDQGSYPISVKWDGVQEGIDLELKANKVVNVAPPQPIKIGDENPLAMLGVTEITIQLNSSSNDLPPLSGFSAPLLLIGVVDEINAKNFTEFRKEKVDRMKKANLEVLLKEIGSMSFLHSEILLPLDSKNQFPGLKKRDKIKIDLKKTKMPPAMWETERLESIIFVILDPFDEFKDVNRSNNILMFPFRRANVSGLDEKKEGFCAVKPDFSVMGARALLLNGKSAHLYESDFRGGGFTPVLIHECPKLSRMMLINQLVNMELSKTNVSQCQSLKDVINEKTSVENSHLSEFSDLVSNFSRDVKAASVDDSYTEQKDKFSKIFETISAVLKKFNDDKSFQKLTFKALTGMHKCFEKMGRRPGGPGMGGMPGMGSMRRMDDWGEMGSMEGMDYWGEMGSMEGMDDWRDMGSMGGMDDDDWGEMGSWENTDDDITIDFMDDPESYEDENDDMGWMDFIRQKNEGETVDKIKEMKRKREKGRMGDMRGPKGKEPKGGMDDMRRPKGKGGKGAMDDMGGPKGKGGKGGMRGMWGEDDDIDDKMWGYDDRRMWGKDDDIDDKMWGYDDRKMRQDDKKYKYWKKCTPSKKKDKMVKMFFHDFVTMSQMDLSCRDNPLLQCIRHIVYTPNENPKDVICSALDKKLRGDIRTALFSVIRNGKSGIQLPSNSTYFWEFKDIVKEVVKEYKPLFMFGLEKSDFDELISTLIEKLKNFTKTIPSDVDDIGFYSIVVAILESLQEDTKTGAISYCQRIHSDALFGNFEAGHQCPSELIKKSAEYGQLTSEEVCRMYLGSKLAAMGIIPKVEMMEDDELNEQGDVLGTSTTFWKTEGQTVMKGIYSDWFGEWFWEKIAMCRGCGMPDYPMRPPMPPMRPPMPPMRPPMPPMRPPMPPMRPPKPGEGPIIEPLRERERKPDHFKPDRKDKKHGERKPEPYPIRF